jgi:hypothetical protein
VASKISVVIDVVADKAVTGLKNFKTSLADAEGGFGKLKVAGGAAMDSLKLHAGEFALAAGTAIVAFGVKAVGAFNDLALEADRFSDVAGIAVEDASRWIEVAGDIGVSGEAVQGAFQKMNKAIADGKLDEFAADIVKAKDGTVDANATFENLVTKIGAIKDPTDRAAAAQKAFGKGYAEIAELMEMSATDLQSALEGVSEQKIIDEQEVERAKVFRASLDTLKDKAEDLTLMLGERLVPAAIEVADAVADAVGPVLELTDWLDRNAGGAERAEGGIISFGKSLMGSAVGPLGDTRDALGDLLTGYDETEEALKDLSSWNDKTGASIAGSSFEARLAATTMNDLCEEVDRTKQSYDKLKSSVDILKGALSNRDAEDAAIQAANELIWANQVAIDTARNHKATEQEKAAALDASKEAIRRSIDATINYIDTLGGIPESKATAIAALIDEGSFAEAERRLRILARNQTVNVDIIARGGAGYGVGARASGGPVSAGAPYLVGERGPELMVPGSNGTVIPNNKLGGTGGGNTLVVNISAMDAASFSPAFMQRLMNEFERTMGRTGRVWARS